MPIVAVAERLENYCAAKLKACKLGYLPADMGEDLVSMEISLSDRAALFDLDDTLVRTGKVILQKYVYMVSFASARFGGSPFA